MFVTCESGHNKRGSKLRGTGSRSRTQRSSRPPALVAIPTPKGEGCTRVRTFGRPGNPAGLLVAPYFKEGKTFYDIPWDVIETYGRADVLATEQVALAQLEAFGTTFEELFHEESGTLAHFASIT